MYLNDTQQELRIPICANIHSALYPCAEHMVVDSFSAECFDGDYAFPVPSQLIFDPPPVIFIQNMVWRSTTCCLAWSVAWELMCRTGREYYRWRYLWCIDCMWLSQSVSYCILQGAAHKNSFVCPTNCSHLTHMMVAQPVDTVLLFLAPRLLRVRDAVDRAVIRVQKREDGWEKCGDHVHCQCCMCM